MENDQQTRSPEELQTPGHDLPATDTQNANYERWSRLPKSRGRQRRDPDAQSIRFQCRDVDDLERQLREYLEAPTAPAEHTTLEFHYPVSAAFMVYAADFRGRENFRIPPKQNEQLYGKLDRRAVSVIDALSQSEDPKDQMRRQKAIAKVCVEACEKADGFRYSFHNNWMSREDKACRFSYFCNDSTLNKGRAANEGAGTSGKKMRKPVYDCHGLIAIKFSNTKQNLEVHYKHVPLHKTYVERAPPPRRDSKRYRLLEVFNPESLPQKRKIRSSEDKEIPKRPRQRRANEDATDMEYSHVDASTEDDVQPLVHFLDAAGREADGTASSPQLNDPSGADISNARTDTAAGNARSAISMSKPQTSTVPGELAGSFRDGNIAWDGGNAAKQAPAKQTPTRQPKQKDAATPLRGIADAAKGVPKSEFEILKAKLEEAEQRIKKLEAEKTHSPQTWHQPNYPFPPPSQYPYQYPPPPYPYPPQAAPPPGYPQSGAYTGPPPSGPVPPGNNQTNGSKPGLRPLQPNMTNPPRRFVSHTPTPANNTSSPQPQILRPLAQALPRPDALQNGNPAALPARSGQEQERTQDSQSDRAQESIGQTNET